MVMKSCLGVSRRDLVALESISGRLGSGVKRGFRTARRVFSSMELGSWVELGSWAELGSWGKLGSSCGLGLGPVVEPGS